MFPCFGVKYWLAERPTHAKLEVGRVHNPDFEFEEQALGLVDAHQEIQPRFGVRIVIEHVDVQGRTAATPKPTSDDPAADSAATGPEPRTSPP